MQQTIQHTTVDALRARLTQGDVCQVIDVREGAEYDAEHIAEARLVPLSTFAPQSTGLDPQQTVYVLCRSGTRARHAAERLQQRGDQDVRVVAGGMQAWIAADYPVKHGTHHAWSLERQVRLVAGTAVLLSVGLSWVVHPGFSALAACIGAGLAFSAITDTCGMAMLLARMPWNQRPQGAAGTTYTRASGGAHMEWSMALALLFSGAIGVSLGLLGGGGSILAVPMLVYVAGVAAQEAGARSLAIVGSTSVIASILHGRQGRLDTKVAALFGGVDMVGAFIGAQFTHHVSNAVLLVVFAVLMLLVGTLMLLRQQREPTTSAPHDRSLPRVLVAGLGVGVVTGFLGVGGGFLIVPALVLFTTVSMHVAVGTSLLVIAINSAAGFVGHLGQGHVPLALTGAFTVAAAVGMCVGTHLAGQIPAHRMRRLFAGFVMAVALFLITANYHALF